MCWERRRSARNEREARKMKWNRNLKNLRALARCERDGPRSQQHHFAKGLRNDLSDQIILLRFSNQDGHQVTGRGRETFRRIVDEHAAVNIGRLSFHSCPARASRSRLIRLRILLEPVSQSFLCVFVSRSLPAPSLGACDVVWRSLDLPCSAARKPLSLLHRSR